MTHIFKIITYKQQHYYRIIVFVSTLYFLFKIPLQLYQCVCSRVSLCMFLQQLISLDVFSLHIFYKNLPVITDVPTKDLAFSILTTPSFDYILFFDTVLSSALRIRTTVCSALYGEESHLMIRDQSESNFFLRLKCKH